MSLSDYPVVTLFSLKVAWSGKSLIYRHVVYLLRKFAFENASPDVRVLHSNRVNQLPKATSNDYHLGNRPYCFMKDCPLVRTLETDMLQVWPLTPKVKKATWAFFGLSDMGFKEIS